MLDRGGEVGESIFFRISLTQRTEQAEEVL
jgi:hypothetical protein